MYHKLFFTQQKWAPGTNREAVECRHVKKFIQPEYMLTLFTIQELKIVEMPEMVAREMEELFSDGGWPFNACPLSI